MNNEYKVFRVFCLTAVSLLLALLLTTGILTAKYQTEQTVFGTQRSVLQVYEKSGGAVLNLNGKVSEINPQLFFKGMDILSFTLLAPVNNFIELGKTIVSVISYGT